MYDVFFNRIRRQNAGYDIHYLGAFGADLFCLSNFFESLWDKPVSGLREDYKAVTLSWAGFALRAVGRISEAAQPMKASLGIEKKSRNFEGAAVVSSNLSELYLTLGDVASAQKYGVQSVSFADRSGNDFQMETKRVRLADAFRQAGKTKAAEKLFIEAEDMQKKRQPENPWFYSIQGFLFCDLLLSLGKYHKVLERAQTTIKIAESQNWLLDIALDNLTIGKALMFQAVDNNSTDFAESEDYLNQAVEGLREAGTQHNLPWGLFARATLSRHKKDFLKSWVDLDEAREIAEYGQMRLHFTDYYLEVCRNIRDQLTVGSKQLANKDYQIIEDGGTVSLSKQEMEAKFMENLEKVEKLVEETGYHRRDGELEELRKSLQ
jgi:tetratricopeptide (TPR) repeat protein